MRNADGLSRLPISGDTEIDGGCINMLKVDSNLPISVDHVRKHTYSDTTSQKIREYVLHGWPQKVDVNIQHYFVKRKCLATEDDCLFYGERILIPFALRRNVLELLHETHIGIVRMKAIARSYVWWPGIDTDIENWSKCCKSCQAMSNKKDESELSNWPKTSKPFERVHIDFFMLEGKTFLILVDSFSKWLEIFPMKKTNAFEVITRLKIVFSVFGLADEIVNDNGPPFGSFEFENFCKSNGVKLTQSPPYHPQSNGEAEVAVRVAKHSLKKIIIDEKTKKMPIESNLLNFLLKYRVTPTTVTGQSPANLNFNFRPKTLMDLLHKQEIGRDIIVPEKEKEIKTLNSIPNSTVNIENKMMESYKINEIVSYQMVWNNFVKWVPAKIVKKISHSIYIITVNGVSRKAHLRQLRKTKTKNLDNWPGIFVNKNNENVEDEFEEVIFVRDDSNKRLRNRNNDIEIKRSERSSKIPRYSYLSYF